MAVPTISAISPSTGQAAGGNMVTITGTNFRTPTLDYTLPPVDLVPTVKVTVNGVDAETVEVLSDTELWFLAPRYTGSPHADQYPTVDVTVTNLDDDGDPIAGETVTEADGYRYYRWVLGAPASDPPMLVIVKQLLSDLMREVARHTNVQTHVDFGEQCTATEIALAELPSLNISVSMPLDPEYSAGDYGDQEVEKTDGSIDVYWGRRTHMLVCDLVMGGEGQREAYHLVQAVEDFVLTNPRLRVEADQDLYSGEYDYYDLELSMEPRQSASASPSGVVVFNAQIRVRGIPVLPAQPVENVLTILEFIYTESSLTGSGPRHTTI